MSTDEIVDLKPSGGGGLDDSGDEQEVTPQGVIEGIDDDEAQGGEGEVDGPDDWLAEVDDETREALGAKYKTPAEAARALASAERLIGSQGKDVGDLRDDLQRMSVELEQLRAGSQNGAGQQQAELPSYADVAGYAAQEMKRVDAGELEPGEAMATVLRAFTELAAAREEKLIETLGKEVAERTAPLDDHKRQTEYAREVTAVRRELGDEAYAEHYQPAAALLEEWGRQDPNFVKNPKSIRTAFNQVITNATISARREAEAGILERSGSGPGGRQPVSAAKAIVDEMDAFTGPRRNGGGGL